MPQDHPAPSRYRPLPPQVDLPAMEREVLAFWRRERHLRRQPGPDRRRRAVDVLRGPADGQRHARHAPRRGAGLQGRVPPVPDHAGLPRPPQGGLGLPRPAGRARGREGARASPASATSRPTASPSSTRSAASRCSGTSTSSRHDRADGLLGRHLARPTGRWTPSTCRASGGRSSRSSTRVCSPRTTGSRRTARAAAPRCPTTSSARGYETVVDPSVYVRFPLTSRPVRRHGRAAGLDHHAVDAGVQHRGRGAPGRHLRRRHRRHRDPGRGRAAGRAGAR